MPQHRLPDWLECMRPSAQPISSSSGGGAGASQHQGSSLLPGSAQGNPCHNMADRGVSPAGSKAAVAAGPPRPAATSSEELQVLAQAPAAVQHSLGAARAAPGGGRSSSSSSSGRHGREHILLGPSDQTAVHTEQPIKQQQEPLQQQLPWVPTDPVGFGQPPEPQHTGDRLAGAESSAAAAAAWQPALSAGVPSPAAAKADAAGQEEGPGVSTPTPAIVAGERQVGA